MLLASVIRVPCPLCQDDLKTLSLISKVSHCLRTRTHTRTCTCNYTHTLCFAVQDPFSANVYSVGFAVDGDQLGFIGECECEV